LDYKPETYFTSLRRWGKERSDRTSYDHLNLSGAA